MSDPIKVLAFAGSTRSGSYNRKLIRHAAGLAEEQGAAVTLIELADYPLPLYDGDLEAEQGIPDNARAIKALFRDHDALLMSCPEYNASVSGVWKNTIDWVSRPMDGQSGRHWFAGKVAALLAASPGPYGGLRGLYHVRAVLNTLGTLALPDQAAVGRAGDAFDESGTLVREDSARRVEAVVESLLETAARLRG